jgi:hypothetical protein
MKKSRLNRSKFSKSKILKKRHVKNQAAARHKFFSRTLKDIDNLETNNISLDQSDLLFAENEA